MRIRFFAVTGSNVIILSESNVLIFGRNIGFGIGFGFGCSNNDSVCVSYVPSGPCESIAGSVETCVAFVVSSGVGYANGELEFIVAASELCERKSEGEGLFVECNGTFGAFGACRILGVESCCIALDVAVIKSIPFFCAIVYPKTYVGSFAVTGGVFCISCNKLAIESNDNNEVIFGGVVIVSEAEGAFIGLPFAVFAGYDDRSVLNGNGSILDSLVFKIDTCESYTNVCCECESSNLILPVRVKRLGKRIAVGIFHYRLGCRRVSNHNDLVFCDFVNIVLPGVSGIRGIVSGVLRRNEGLNNLINVAFNLFKNNAYCPTVRACNESCIVGDNNVLFCLYSGVDACDIKHVAVSMGCGIVAVVSDGVIAFSPEKIFCAGRNRKCCKRAEQHSEYYEQAQQSFEREFLFHNFLLVFYKGSAPFQRGLERSPFALRKIPFNPPYTIRQL